MLGSVVYGLAGTSPPLRPCRTLAPTGLGHPSFYVPAFIMLLLLAASRGMDKASDAAFALVPWLRSALRRTCGGATMPTAGGACTQLR